MRKVLCLVIVFIVFLSANSFADDCEHLYEILIEYGTYSRGYHAIGPAKHVWRYEYWQRCEYCGDFRLMGFEDEAEPHSFVASSDWHGNDDVHHYEEVCTKCYYIRQYTQICSDDSCPRHDAMLRLIVDAEDQ